MIGKPYSLMVYDNFIVIAILVIIPFVIMNVVIKHSPAVKWIQYHHSILLIPSSFPPCMCKSIFVQSDVLYLHTHADAKTCDSPCAHMLVVYPSLNLGNECGCRFFTLLVTVSTHLYRMTWRWWCCCCSCYHLRKSYTSNKSGQDNTRSRSVLWIHRSYYVIDRMLLAVLSYYYHSLVFVLLLWTRVFHMECVN